MRRFRLFAILAGLLLAITASAQPASVIVRTSIQPRAGAIIGQQLSLFVDVLFPGTMPHPPRVTVPEPPGAQVFRFESQATTITDQIGGQGYIGQRFEFGIYPRRGGKLAIPPPLVTLLGAGDAPVGSAIGQGLDVDITVPNGIDASGSVIATTGLSLDQHWAPNARSTMKPGEALVRTITREAPGMPGLAMPDLAFTAPAGIRVYVDNPIIEDRKDRGQITGKRIDRATYVFEAAGRYELPKIMQPWWDLSTNRPREAEGAGLAVSVTAAPPRGLVQRLIDLSPWQGWIAGLVGILLLVWAVWRVVRGIGAAWSRRRLRWAMSEEKAFRDVIVVGKNGPLPAIYQAFTVWRNRLPDPAAPPVAQAAHELEQMLFGPEPEQVAKSTINVILRRLERIRPTLIGKGPPRSSGAPPANPG
jgi:hypothetical protein